MNKIDPTLKRLHIQNISYQKIIQDLERKLRAEQRKTTELTSVVNKLKREQLN